MKRIIRATTVALSLALAGTLGGVAPVHAAATPGSPAASAAHWIAGQLKDGALNYESQYGPYTDYGMSIDAGYMLQRAGTEPTALASVVAAVKSNAVSYASYGGDYFAGTTGKAASFVKDTGGDPTNINGTDFVAKLNSMVSTDAAIDGRMLDQGTYGGPITLTINQAWAVHALTDAGSAAAAAATKYLLAQQCAVGYFPENLPAASEPVDKQTCDASKGAPSTDTTALVTWLLAKDGNNPAAAAAIAKAKQWLISQQHVDGSWSGNGVNNANTTGLATLVLTGTPQAAAGAKWLVARQATAGSGALASNAGALAYDDAALTTGRTAGITTATRSQWLYATVQGGMGLFDYVAPAANPVVVGPQLKLKADVVKRRKRIVVTVSNLKPGERLVVRYKGRVVRRGKAGVKGNFVARFRSGKKAGTFVIAAIGKKSGRGTTTIKVVR